MDGAWMTALAWAAQTGTATDGGTGERAPLFPPEMLFMFLIIGLLFYLLILKPQRSDQRKREKMIEEMGKGDQVVTAGGIHGTIEGVDKATGTVTVNVAPKVTLKLSRSSISSVSSKKNKPKSEE